MRARLEEADGRAARWAQRAGIAEPPLHADAGADHPFASAQVDAESWPHLGHTRHACDELWWPVAGRLQKRADCRRRCASIARDSVIERLICLLPDWRCWSLIVAALLCRVGVQCGGAPAVTEPPPQQPLEPVAQAWHRGASLGITAAPQQPTEAADGAVSWRGGTAGPSLHARVVRPVATRWAPFVKAV